VFSRGQKTAFEKWPVFGRILTYVLKTEWQGDSPIDLLIEHSNNFPFFARPRKESYEFDPQQM
jgi:hypothetical protein